MLGAALRKYERTREKESNGGWWWCTDCGNGDIGSQPDFPRSRWSFPFRDSA